MSQRFERGFDDAAIGMMMLTQKLRVIRANDALSAMLGRGTDELVGHSILEFTHPDDVKRSVDKREKMVAGTTDARWSSATCVLTERSRGGGDDGARRTGDAEPYFFSQLQDVTEQCRAQRQKALIADLGRRALECADAIMLMGEAMRMVREILGT